MDPASFDRLYAGSCRRLVGQVFAVTGELGSAQDAVQDAFMRAWLRWDRISGYDNPEAWVRRVAIRAAVSRWRHGRMMTLGVSRDQSVTAEFTGQYADLLAALGELPARQRAALVLHHMVGLSVLDVAEELGVPEGTVKAWLSRGRVRLAQRLHQAQAAEDRHDAEVVTNG